MSTGLSTISAKVDNIDTDYKTYVDASVQRLRNESNTEDENIRRDVSSAINSLRNETKNYTDDKFSDVSADLNSIRTDLTHQIDVVDSKYNASINALRDALNEEIRDRNEDLVRELANEDASLKNYTDQLRRDTSNAISDVSGYLKDYVDTKFDAITDESRQEDERIEQELKAFINASVVRLSDEVSAYVNNYKQGTDTSLAALKTYVDEKDNQNRVELLELQQEGDASVYNALNNKFTNSIETLEEKHDRNISVLRSEVSAGLSAEDASLKLYIDTKISETEDDLNSTIDNINSTLAQDIEETAGAIRNEVSTGLANVKELSKEYTDEKIAEASTFAHNENVALNASVAAAIAETDASIREDVATELNVLANDYRNYTDQKVQDASVFAHNENVALNASLSETINTAATQIRQELSDGLAANETASTEYTNDSVEQLRNELRSLVNTTADELSNDFDASLNTLKNTLLDVIG